MLRVIRQGNPVGERDGVPRISPSQQWDESFNKRPLTEKTASWGDHALLLQKQELVTLNTSVIAMLPLPNSVDH